MSVIAKMYVVSSGQVPDGALIRLSCVYDTHLADQSAEDVRFSKSSPSGEATFAHATGLAEQQNFYLLFDEDLPSFEDCDFGLKVRCHCVHDYGTSKQIEISTAYDQEGVDLRKLPVTSKSPSFHLKMTIDNPAASIQFEPQKIYYLTFFSAERFTMHEAIAKARHRTLEAPADAS